MRKAPIVAIVLAGLSLAACAPRYYDRDGYGGDRYYGPHGYVDRDRYDDTYSRDDGYARPYRNYHDGY